MSQQIQDGVLFGLMNFGPDCWYGHGANLTPEMFDDQRREIYQAIAKLNRAGDAADIATVSSAVSSETADLVKAICVDVFLSRGAMKSYCEHLKAAHREAKARDIGAKLQDTGDIETAKADLLQLETSRVSETVDAGGAVKALMDDLSAKQEGEGGLRTGLADLDNLIGGLEPADFCVIAARPSMGKTALMLNIAARCGVPVGIFSLEMSTSQLMTRLVASWASGTHYGRLRFPKNLNDADWPKITHATQQIQKTGLMINDGGGLTISQIEAEAWRMVKAHGVGLICVDYLQLVNCKSESRFETVSEVSRRLKSLAKNLKVPVIALSQMNRGIEGRGKPIPKLSDLRESGQIEQDADQIIFLYREEVIVEKSRPGEADLIVAKNRGGEIGTATVAWQGVYQRFVNMARDHQQEAAL